MEVINGGVAVDGRGSVRFVNDFDFKGVKRFYQVQNHEVGFVRAFHYHDFESKYVYVVKGSILLYAVEVNHIHKSNSIVNKFILSSEKPSVLYIPAKYANGFKTLTNDTIVQFFSTTSLENSLDDDIRFPYDEWGNWDNDYR